MAYRGSSAWGSKLDCAKVLGAALSWFLLKQNDAAGMLTLPTGGDAPQFIRPSQKSSQFGLLLRQLDSLKADGGSCLASLLGHAVRLVHRRSVILFLSDLLETSDKVSLALKHLRFLGHELIVFQILDGDEIDFPFDRASIFEDLEAGGRHSVDPSKVRAKYLQRFQAFMAQYQDLFRRLEIPHCVVRTDQNPWAALALFLAERQRFS